MKRQEVYNAWKKQKSQIRIVDQNWYTFRETANDIMRRVKSTSKVISL